jgi:catechol 2,3-dioxygenase-like lactoylglutathione lyase family enzyme
MKVVDIGAVTINVKNLDEAIDRFSDVLGLTFVKLPGPGSSMKRAGASQESERPKIKMAIDRTGYLELVESVPPVEKEGISNIHFRVSDIEQATEELTGKGLRLTATVDDPVGFKEAVFAPDNMHGVPLLLVEYSGSVLVDVLEKSSGK